MKRFTRLLCAAAAVFTALPAWPASYTADLAFSATDQSMWGSSAPIGFDTDTNLFGTSWNLGGRLETGYAHPHGDGVKGTWPRLCLPFGGPCVGGDEYVISDGWDLGQWGAGLNAGTSGSLGLNLKTSLDAGKVSVAYPIHTTFSVSDTASVGGQVVIRSSYSVLPQAQIKTSSPQGNIQLTLDAAYQAAVDGQICTGGCQNVSVPLANGSARVDLLSAESRGLQGSTGGALGGILPYSGAVHVPHIETTGTLGADGKLSSAGEDRFLSLGLNLSDIVGAAIGIPLNGGFEVGPLSASYKTLDLGLNAGLSLEQAFSFGATPWVRYDLSDGRSLLGRLGEDLSFDMLSAQDLSIRATVFLLEPELTQSTRLTGDVGLDLQALQLAAGVDIPRIDVFGLGSVGGGRLGGSIGPLVDAHPSAPLGGGLGLFEGSWQVNGFESLAAADMVVRVVPEPDAAMLLVAGLISLAGFLRRRPVRR